MATKIVKTRGTCLKKAGVKLKRPVTMLRAFLDLLQCYDILCLRTFLAISDSEFDFLTFSESFEPRAADRTKMSKNVRT